MPDGQEPNRAGHRRNPKLEILFDLRTVVVDEIAVDARHAALVEAAAHASFQVVAQREQPFAADRDTVEVVHLEDEIVEVADNHVSRDATILPFRKEPAEG